MTEKDDMTCYLLGTQLIGEKISNGLPAPKAYLHAARCLDAKYSAAWERPAAYDNTLDISVEMAKEIEALCHEIEPEGALIEATGLSLNATDKIALRQATEFSLQKPIALRCSFYRWTRARIASDISLDVDLFTLRSWLLLLRDEPYESTWWIFETATHLSLQNSLTCKSNKFKLLDWQVFRIQSLLSWAAKKMRDGDDIHKSVLLPLLEEATNAVLPLKPISYETGEPCPIRLGIPLQALYITQAMLDKLIWLADHSTSSLMLSNTMTQFIKNNRAFLAASQGIWLRDDSWPDEIAFYSVLCCGQQKS